MNYQYYQRKLDDVIVKCSIEARVEIFVYNVLDSILDSEDVSLVDINSIWRRRNSRLVTGGRVSDIAVLPTDFEYNNVDNLFYLPVSCIGKCGYAS